MKILFLNGSPRKNGYTIKVMKAIEKEISSGHTVEWVHAYDLNLKPCISCMQCRPNKECQLPKDDGHDVWHKILLADALVIGTPTYFGNMSAPLKMIVDRSVTAFEEIAKSGLEMPIRLHTGQKAIMVTACNCPPPFSEELNQSKGTLNAMKAVLMAGGYDSIGSITLTGAVTHTELPVEIQVQAKTLAAILQS